MYVIKHLAEDFVVEEITSLPPQDSTGKYTYFLLKKRNYTTLKALQQIAKKLHVPLKRLGYAGNKDKKAVTTQLCSVKGVPASRVERMSLQDIEITVRGTGNEPVTLGMLEGNRFHITIRNLEEKPSFTSAFLNLFGEQRFGRNNAAIGKAIVQKDFKKAAELIRETSNKTLKDTPKRIVKLYIAAYQSWLWNEGVQQYKGNGKTFPLIGYGTDLEEHDTNIQNIVKKMMQQEHIQFRDFVIKQIPSISAEGNDRKITIKVKALQVGELADDDQFPGKKKIKVSFTLPKGSYATEFIRQHLAPA